MWPGNASPSFRHTGSVKTCPREDVCTGMHGVHSSRVGSHRKCGDNPSVHGWWMDDGWMMGGWVMDDGGMGGWMMDGWMMDGWMMDG